MPDAGRGRWVLAATILGSSMAFIDGTAVNVALPALQRDLHAGVSELQWFVESYLLLLASLLLVGGALGDRYGRKRVFAAGVVLFAIASLACGLAPSSGWLIAARALQGVGGALLVPGSLAIISAAFGAADAAGNEDAERGRAIGTWSGFTAILAAFGQVLGGWLVDAVTWRAIFFLNVPLALLTLAMLWKVPESRDPAARHAMDWTGAALATGGLGGLVFALIEAPTRGLAHPGVAGAAVVGVLALVAFGWTEARTPHPMVPPGLFRSQTFKSANGLTLLLYAALGGAMFFVPYAMIQVHGYSATAAGAAMLPFILEMFVLSRWAGGLIGRFGARLPLVVGPSVAAVGFGLFALPGTSGSYWATFFPAVAVLGLGMAIAVAPLTTAVMSAVGRDKAGVASGINNAVSRVGGLLAVALFGVVITVAFGRALDARLDGLGLPPAARQTLARERERLAEVPAPAALAPADQKAVEGAVDEAFVAGFRVAMALAAGLAIASAGVAARWIEPRAGAEASS
jgi:EmrB/QacA subfamily drug resistance transporter